MAWCQQSADQRSAGLRSARLTRRGGIRSEFTITKIADNHFLMW